MITLCIPSPHHFPMNIKASYHRARVESAIKRTTKGTAAALIAIQDAGTELEKLARCGDVPGALALARELGVAMDEAAVAFAGIAARLRESVKEGER